MQYKRENGPPLTRRSRSFAGKPFEAADAQPYRRSALCPLGRPCASSLHKVHIQVKKGQTAARSSSPSSQHYVGFEAKSARMMHPSRQAYVEEEPAVSSP